MTLARRTPDSAAFTAAPPPLHAPSADVITADNSFTFVAYFLLAFGVTFELPLVLTFVALVGVAFTVLYFISESLIRLIGR